MQLVASILYDTVYHSAPIILCVVGGVFAYKANVLNIALEGMMLAGAFVSTLVTYLTGSVLLGVCAAVAVSAVLGVVFSVWGVSLKGNVIIVGLAINMLVPAVAGFALVLMGVSNIALADLSVSGLQVNIPVLADVPLLGSVVSGHPPITYVAFASVWLMYVLMYKTRFGTYVRVVGENEDAARSIGLKADRYKYIAVVIGAVCCALAGANLSTERLGLFTNNMTASRGFIAVAAIYCGRGDPVRSALYAVLFGFARALSINLAVYAGPAAGLFDVIPYVVMVAVLTAVSVARRKNVRERGFAHG